MAIKRYQTSRDLLGKKDPKTSDRENSGLKQWAALMPNLPIVAESFDAKLLLDFAEWRKKQAKEKGWPIEGEPLT